MGCHWCIWVGGMGGMVGVGKESSVYGWWWMGVVVGVGLLGICWKESYYASMELVGFVGRLLRSDCWLLGWSWLDDHHWLTSMLGWWVG